MRLASWLMPEVRMEWAAAMRSEFQNIEGGYQAAGWALGCLAASIETRVSTMASGNFQISNWVLSIAMACCFAPLTLFWLFLLFDGSINPAVLRQYLEAPDGFIVLGYLLSMVVLGVCGPIGLFFAFRHFARKRTVRNRRLGIALLTALMLLGVVYAGTPLVLGGPGQLLSWLGGILLFIILPIVGATYFHSSWKIPAPSR
jgi:hypothetical protein